MSFKSRIYLGGELVSEGSGESVFEAENDAVARSPYTAEALANDRATFVCEEVQS